MRLYSRVALAGPFSGGWQLCAGRVGLAPRGESFQRAGDYCGARAVFVRTGCVGTRQCVRWLVFSATMPRLFTNMRLAPGAPKKPAGSSGLTGRG
jgi:hypothetical protein